MPESVADATVRIAAARYLGMLAPEEVIAWAVRRVAVGDSGDALVQIAALRADASATDLDVLLRDLTEEVGAAIGSKRDAALTVATATARDLDDDVIEPITAARRMRDIAHRAPAVEPALREFVGLAGEWEDDPQGRRQYEDDIRRLGRSCLAEWGHEGWPS